MPCGKQNNRKSALGWLGKLRRIVVVLVFGTAVSSGPQSFLMSMFGVLLLRVSGMRLNPTAPRPQNPKKEKPSNSPRRCLQVSPGNFVSRCTIGTGTRCRRYPNLAYHSDHLAPSYHYYHWHRCYYCRIFSCSSGSKVPGTQQQRRRRRRRGGQRDPATSSLARSTNKNLKGRLARTYPSGGDGLIIGETRRTRERTPRVPPILGCLYGLLSTTTTTTTSLTEADHGHGAPSPYAFGGYFDGA